MLGKEELCLSKPRNVYYVSLEYIAQSTSKNNLRARFGSEALEPHFAR
jgi:hypothetical protein